MSDSANWSFSASRSLLIANRFHPAGSKLLGKILYMLRERVFFTPIIISKATRTNMKSVRLTDGEGITAFK